MPRSARRPAPPPEPRRRLLWAGLLAASLALVACCVGVALWSAGRPTAPRWQPFEVAGVRVEVPDTPALDPVGPSPETSRSYSVRLKKPDQLYTIGTFPVPPGADPDRFLDESLTGIVRTVPDAAEQPRSDSPHDGFPGRRVFAGGPGGGVASRVVLIGDRAYQLTVTGEGVSPESADVARFLDSFSIADPELTAPARATTAKGAGAAAQAKAAAEWKANEERAKREREEAERKAREAFAAARYAGPPVPAASTLKGLVLYLPLDEAAGESAADAVSGKPLGRLVGGAKFVPGVRGHGVDVTAPGAWLDLGAAAGAFRFGPDDPYTVAGWYRARVQHGFVLHASSADNTKAKLSVLLGWGNVIGYAESAPWVADPKTGFKRSEARLDAGLDQARAADDRWHHFAVTHAGKGTDEGMSLSIDGRLVVARAVRTQIDLGKVERVQVGGPSPNPSMLSLDFPGMVDEICVFDRRLAADEVKKLAGR